MTAPWLIFEGSRDGGRQTSRRDAGGVGGHGRGSSTNVLVSFTVLFVFKFRQKNDIFGVFSPCAARKGERILG
jgi:hypothetical protein